MSVCVSLFNQYRNITAASRCIVVTCHTWCPEYIYVFHSVFSLSLCLVSLPSLTFAWGSPVCPSPMSVLAAWLYCFFFFCLVSQPHLVYLISIPAPAVHLDCSEFLSLECFIWVLASSPCEICQP